MSTKYETAGEALFGKIRRELLSLFFLNPQRSFFLLELVGILRTGRGGVQRELASLVQSGLIKREKSGIKVFFSVLPDCPLLQEIQRLLIRLGDHESMLASAVKKYGSFITTAVLSSKGAASRVNMLVASEEIPDGFVDEIHRIHLITGIEIGLKVLRSVELSGYLRDHPESGWISNESWMLLAGTPEDLTADEPEEEPKDRQLDLFSGSSLNW